MCPSLSCATLLKMSLYILNQHHILQQIGLFNKTCGCRTMRLKIILTSIFFPDYSRVAMDGCFQTARRQLFIITRLRPVACGGPDPPAFCLTPCSKKNFRLRRAFVHAWPPRGSGGPLLQNCHATGLARLPVFSHHQSVVYPRECWNVFLVVGCPS